MDLQREFDKRGPWKTRFLIGDREYGGEYDAVRDVRLEWFRAQFPEARSILELGSLEGGHSFGLAALPLVERVVAIEGRRRNVERARFVQGVLGQSKVSFVHANLERFDLAGLGRFDVVFCSGLLYHLPEPWKLVERVAQVAPAIYLWTHYAREREAKRTRHGYRGRLFWEWLFFFEPLSGLSPVSFWPTRAALLQMLADYGLGDVTTIEDNPAHEHGPSLTLAARRRPGAGLSSGR